MRRRFPVDRQELTDYDLFLMRQFCSDELKKYLRPMRDFWTHEASYSERDPGEYPILDARFTGAVGYRIEKRKVKQGPVRGVAAYPFVRTRALKVLPARGSSKLVMRRVMDDPLRVEEFYCVLDGDKRIAFLTEAAFAATCSGKSIEACVVLGREEAYAILAGKTLAKTRAKLVRVFDMEEGEWVEASIF